MIFSNQEITVEKGDAPEFILIINQIMKNLIFQYGVHEISIVKIKNWFDYKWLNYSGKTVVHFEKIYDHEIHAALKSKWREKVTVPPFNPNRVLSENFFRKQPTGNKKI